MLINLFLTFQNIDALSVLMNLWAVLGISFVFMYYQIGIYASIAAILSIFVFLPIQLSIGRLVFYLRLEIR